MKIKGLTIPLLCSIAVLIVCSGCDRGREKPSYSTVDFDSPKDRVELHSAEDAVEYFRKTISREQNRACNCVSPVFLQTMPPDMAEIKPEDRKQLFISILLPVIARENLRIASERKKILALKEKVDRHKRLFWHEQAFLNRMCTAYGVKNRNFDKLLKRVDIIPLSLALAQAIVESGWGTSRFAVQGNSLYGVHRPPETKKKYILSKSGKIKVASYDSIGASTRHYLQLLNSVSAYDGLRTRRLRMRANKRTVSGMLLAETLSGYSEIGNKYVDTLAGVIRTYRLEDLNTVQFREDQKAVELAIN